MRRRHLRTSGDGGRLAAVSTERASNGFSLVELLVVVGIISLLVAFLMPSLQRARIQAKRVACASNLRQIGVAIIAYGNDNRGHLFPNRNADYSNGFTTSGHGPAAWFGPPEQWTFGPIANASVTASDWPWADAGGADGPLELLYPKYIRSVKIFESPSSFDYCYANVPYPYTYYLDWNNFAKFVNSGRSVGSYQMWMAYVGAVYGQMGKPRDSYGHEFWDSYWIQGYYPYYEYYLSPKGAMLWDVGSLAFYFGWGHPACPFAPEGVHRVGGHFLMIDNSVIWQRYQWIPGQ